MIQAARSPARRAFTIVELMVILGVLMVLTGLMLPALSGSIERA